MENEQTAGYFRKNIQIGTAVEVVQKQDQRSGKLTRGNCKADTHQIVKAYAWDKSNVGNRRSRAGEKYFARISTPPLAKNAY